MKHVQHSNFDTSLLVCCTAMQDERANAHKHTYCKCGVVFLAILEFVFMKS